MFSDSLLNEKQEKLLIFLDLSDVIEGKTKLQKLIFLGEKEHSLNSGFEFVKYNYGPYSFDLNNNLNVLKELGLISIKTDYFESENNSVSKIYIYSLTQKGKRYVESIRTKYTDFIESSKDVISKWNKKPLGEIIKYVYSKYM